MRSEEKLFLNGLYLTLQLDNISSVAKVAELIKIVAVERVFIARVASTKFFSANFISAMCRVQ